MKQSDIRVALDLQNKIREYEKYLEKLKQENVITSVDFQIEMAVAGNNYRRVTNNISSGIKDTIRDLLIADLESQIEFMVRKIEKM